MSSATYQYFEDVNWGLLATLGGRGGLRVLDVGCGFATTSARIQELGNDVTGIEGSAAACEVAGSRLARVVHADLESADLGDAAFDVLDLRRRARASRLARRHAAPLPEMARAGRKRDRLAPERRASGRSASLISSGRWQYEETGVLDRTHLRFFTRRSARWLLREAGLEPLATTYNPGLVRPFVPLAKKLLASGRGGGRRAESGCDSRVAAVSHLPEERLSHRAGPGFAVARYAGVPDDLRSEAPS